MNKFAIFGNPVKHSKSPQMQNAGFNHINFDATYIKHHLENGEYLKEEFLQNGYSGANITVPHKEVAYTLCDEVRGIAKDIKAVNTYVLEDDKIIAYNSDAPGFLKAIEEFGKLKSVLLLGAGGTAKAITIALKSKNIDVAILNRSEKNLEFFKSHDFKCFTWENFELEKYDLVINSTSAGLKDENLPCSIELCNDILKNSSFAFDCIYGKITPFLALAQDCGLKIKDGEDMLLYQGLIAFELFTKTKADNTLIEAMRRGLKGE